MSVLVFAPNPALERVALVDQFQSGEPQKPMRVSTFAGGSGIRAANVARLLRANVLALGFVGGHLGALLRDCLDRQDIPHVLTPISDPGGTRGDFLLLDKEKGVVTEVPEGSPDITDAEADKLLATLDRHLADAAVLVVADGQMGANADLFRRAIAAGSAAGVPTICDVRGPALEAVLEERPWLVRVNLKTFQLRTETSLQYDSAILDEARALIERGVGNVVVTLAEEGALLINSAGAWRVKPPIVSYFNPTGCGETLVGAIAARWAAGERDLREALRVGCAAASVNVTHDEPGYATPGEVNILLPKTTVEKIA